MTEKRTESRLINTQRCPRCCVAAPSGATEPERLDTARRLQLMPLG